MKLPNETVGEYVYSEFPIDGYTGLTGQTGQTTMNNLLDKYLEIVAEKPVLKALFGQISGFVKHTLETPESKRNDINIGEFLDWVLKDGSLVEFINLTELFLSHGKHLTLSSDASWEKIGLDKLDFNQACKAVLGLNSRGKRLHADYKSAKENGSTFKVELEAERIAEAA